MDSYYFRQIRLPSRLKAELIHALMRFITAQHDAVPREDAFFKQFVTELSAAVRLKVQAADDPWLTEHVARLFWVCCELGLLKYQYPYPHRGQTYLPTRAGRIVARTPRTVTLVVITMTYIVAITADPFKHFNRVRNVVTVVTGLLLWWRHQELSPLILVASIAAGMVGTWIASFLSSLGDRWTSPHVVLGSALLQR